MGVDAEELKELLRKMATKTPNDLQAEIYSYAIDACNVAWAHTKNPDDAISAALDIATKAEFAAKAIRRCYGRT